jgi:hypothetical protein
MKKQWLLLSGPPERITELDCWTLWNATGGSLMIMLQAPGTTKKECRRDTGSQVLQLNVVANTKS